jgi:hypothetical protein
MCSQGQDVMEKTDRDPSAYLDTLPEEVRASMQSLDQLLSGIMVGQSRVLWEGVFWGGTNQVIIGYGDISTTQSRGRTVDWFMVGLALQKQYISIYVNAVEDRQYVVEKYRDQLGKAKVGKASISFKRLDDIDLAGLTRVVAIARDQLADQT